MRIADPLAVGLAAVIGICVALVICIIALIMFVIVFCNLKIKDDTNIRKRLLANDALDEEKQLVDQLYLQNVYYFFPWIK